MILKPLSNNVLLGTTANAVFGARSLRVLNTSAGVALIGIYDPVAANALIGEVILDKNTFEVISKKKTDTVTSNVAAGVFASSVAYSG